jgi:hypothetical protein
MKHQQFNRDPKQEFFIAIKQNYIESTEVTALPPSFNY